MRVTATLLALAISTPAMSAAPAVGGAKSPPAANCPRTASHFAGKGSLYRGDQVTPRKLSELPPAIGYMAVYRTVNGCEVPMTIVEYRTGRRP